MSERVTRRVAAPVRRQRISLAAAAAVAALTGPAGAAPFAVNWVPLGTGDYTLAANWDNNAVPYNRADTSVENPFLIVGNGGDAQAAVDAQGAFLNIGMRPTESGTVELSAGTMTLGELRVGGREIIPSYITGTSDTPNAGGIGTFIQTGGTLTVTYRDPTNTEPPVQSMYIGDAGMPSANTANGYYKITAGSLTSGIATDDSIVVGTGVGTKGTFVQEGGNVTSSGFIIVARRGATGTYSMTGGTLAAAGDFMWVGDGDSTGITSTVGSVTQVGGAVTVKNALEIGRRSATGSYDISGGGTLSCSMLVVGASGSGTDPTLLHGRGTFTISGPASGTGATEVTVTGNGNVGFTTTTLTTTGGDSTGTLTMNGGHITYSASNAIVGVGNGPGGVGVINLNGGTFDLNATPAGGGSSTALMELRRNSGAAGTLNVNGGTLHLNNLLTNGGTVNISTDTATITTMTLSSGGTLKTDNTINLGTNITFGNGTVNVNSGSLALSGTMTSNARTLTKTGAGTLTISGTQSHTGASAYTVSAGTLNLNANGGVNLGINGNGGTVNFGLNQTLRQITAGGGTVNVGTFNASSTGAVTLTGGSITGTTGVITGASYDVRNGTISAILAGTGALTKTTTGTVSLSGVNTYSGATNANAGKLVLAAPLTTSSAMNVAASAKAELATGGGNTLVTPALSIAGATDAWTAQLDVHDNDVILRSTAANRVTDVARITNQLKQGLNATTNSNQALFWTGQGIITSNGWQGGSNYTGIGVTYNDKAAAGLPTAPLYTSFDGQTVGINDVLVKYTWFGDADLDGAVTSNDYFQIDTGFLGAKTGWINGDFDYNGVVNSNDYFLIDSAFLAQGGTILAPASAASAPLGAVTAVPEPASPGVFAFVSAGMFLRRRRNCPESLNT